MAIGSWVLAGYWADHPASELIAPVGGLFRKVEQIKGLQSYRSAMK
jgi:hypothetical protein